MRKLHRSHIFTAISLVSICVTLLTYGNSISVNAEKNIDDIVHVVLQRVYLDGEISEEMTTESISSLDDILELYTDWKIIQQSERKLVLQKNIDDISPLLKTNGYFGISEDNTLSIFNGKPESSDVIQSFFQIDIEKLESRKHDELLKGIRIQSKDQYLEVIKAFETYSRPVKK